MKTDTHTHTEVQTSIEYDPQIHKLYDQMGWKPKRAQEPQLNREKNDETETYNIQTVKHMIFLLCWQCGVKVLKNKKKKRITFYSDYRPRVELVERRWETETKTDKEEK